VGATAAYVPGPVATQASSPARAVTPQIGGQSSPHALSRSATASGHELGRMSVTPLSDGPRLQRTLTVSGSPASLPTGPLSRPDPATALTPAARFSMMDTVIQGLCDEFEVDSLTGEVLTKSRTTHLPSELAASARPVGCCCLGVLTDSSNAWTIEVSQVAGPQTFLGTRQVVLSPTTTPVDFGSFTPGGTLAFQGQVPAAGHELCGHAALFEVGAHPVGGDRLREDVHDPTVNIENAISTEQGVPASGLRGLAASGPHRGESVDRITASGFPLNGSDPSSLPGTERSKLSFAADYSRENNSFVDVIGHSDPVGSAAAKTAVSRDRADKAKAFLITAGVPPTITKFGLPTTSRFTRVVGVSDTQPPPPPLAASHANWRRVEVLMAGFPAGAQTPPASTPTTVTPHTRRASVPRLKASPDPCVAVLVGSGYP
jgi:outer membrane protein OmpA-like peptidoglycan-associated protein